MPFSIERADVAFEYCKHAQSRRTGSIRPPSTFAAFDGAVGFDCVLIRPRSQGEGNLISFSWPGTNGMDKGPRGIFTGGRPNAILSSCGLLQADFVNFVATLDGRAIDFRANAIVMGAITATAVVEFHSIILGAADRSFV